MQVSGALSAEEAGQIIKLQDVPWSTTTFRNTHTNKTLQMNTPPTVQEILHAFDKKTLSSLDPSVHATETFN
jgi:hypothetical protein